MDTKYSIRTKIKEALEENRRILNFILDSCGDKLIILSEICIKKLKTDKKILLFGNGGSATQAEHIAAELVGKFYNIRKPLPAIAFSTSSAIITATANDISFEDIFSRQIEALGRKGDIAIGLSTSGNSINVINAIKKANDLGLYTVALTGESGGKLKDIVNLCINVPSHKTPRIQEMHLLIGHILCEIIEYQLFQNYDNL
jgi:D-sedoheptulose 7-phosphate isomerase